MEKKFLDIENLQLKENANGKKEISGYASIFNNVDSYGDIVSQGAFSKTLKNKQKQVKLLFNHDKNFVIGVIKFIEQDEKGLFFIAELLDGVQLAEEVYIMLKNQALNGVSIGYYVEDYEKNKKGNKILKTIDLLEISIVTFPANEKATIEQVKSADSINERIFDLYQKTQKLNFNVKKLSNFFVN